MKISFSRRGLATIALLTLQAGAAFHADAQVVQIATGTANTPLYAVGPIYMSTTLFYRYSRFAYLYTQAELAAAGITFGTQILGVGWQKSTANSTAGPAAFSIYMKNTSTAAYANASESWANLNTGSMLVYSESAQSIPVTASPNYIDFTLDAPFQYTGGSLEILTEWDISAAPAPIATGPFEWVNTTVADRIYASGNTSLPTTLSSTTNNTDIDNRRPVIQFTLQGSTAAIPDLSSTSLNIWPNPAEDVLNIRSGSPLERIELIDALGKIVLVDRPQGGIADHQIALGGLEPGAYLVRVQTGAGPVVRRVTVW
ncbi:MAG: T9SS type A sorting domain-containing protein [Flavobacteriales bacterium]|nr:T9SS type A sorting domain-containing protein [Flavobacteriales bacterium]